MVKEQALLTSAGEGALGERSLIEKQQLSSRWVSRLTEAKPAKHAPPSDLVLGQNAI